MNRSPRSQPSDTATDGSPVNAAGARTAAMTQTAAMTVSAACVQTSSRRPPASSSGPAESTAARTPANRATLPIEMAAVRSCGGKYRAAILVMEFSTSGWPAAITNCPARAQPNDSGPPSRSRAPAPVRTAPADSARPEADIEPPPAGQRQDHVHQREDHRQVPDGTFGDAHRPVRLGRDGRVGQPQQLGAGGQQAIPGQDHPPVRPDRADASRGRTPSGLCTHRAPAAILPAPGPARHWLSMPGRGAAPQG